MASLRIPTYNHNSIAYSPFHPNTLALASGTNFGLSGRGAVNVVSTSSNSAGLKLVRRFETPDCAFDLAWAETNPDQILAACGDGSCILFDLTSPDARPVAVWREHSREVFGVDCSNLDKTKFATCSWDGNIKLWDLNAADSLLTIPPNGPDECVYTCLFSPHQPHLLGSTTSTGHFRLHDLRTGQTVSSFQAHFPETLSFDWNKYNPEVIATGGVDAAIRLWDLRKTQSTAISSANQRTPNEWRGHRFAVKRIQWSPFDRDLLATTSYDMTCKIWSTRTANTPAAKTYTGHKEFVHAVAWSLQNPAEIATASWDQEVHIWTAK